MKKEVLCFRFFVGDIISGKWDMFYAIWLRLPGTGPQPVDIIFDLGFYWKLGYNPNLLSL